MAILTRKTCPHCGARTGLVACPSCGGDAVRVTDEDGGFLHYECTCCTWFGDHFWSAFRKEEPLMPEMGRELDIAALEAVNKRLKQYEELRDRLKDRLAGRASV